MKFQCTRAVKMLPQIVWTQLHMRTTVAEIQALFGSLILSS